MEVKSGAKVLQPAAVTQDESFGSEFLKSIITCGFYNDIHRIFIMIFIEYMPTYLPTLLLSPVYS